MPQAISPEHRATLDRLLSELAGGIDGAVDFWTLVCFFPENLGFDRQGFVAEKSARIRGLVDQVGVTLQEANLLGEPSVRRLLEAMLRACDQLRSAFLILEQFRAVSLVEVRSAVQLLAEAYSELLAAIQELGTTSGIPVSYWRGRTAEQQEYFQKILHGVFDLYCQAHPAKQQTVVVQGTP